MENAEHSGDRRFHRTLLILVLLPVLYLASIGPLCGLYQRGVISFNTSALLNETVLLPVTWIMIETDFAETPLGAAYMRYIELFEP